MGNFFFLRHGQTDFNRDGLWTGSTDVPLNSNGEAEIVFLAANVGGLNIRNIFTSPLRRAKKTAEIINRVFNATVIENGNLSERSFGILEGVEKTLNSRSQLDSIDSVEKKSVFLARVNFFISSIELNEHTLIVSHSGVFKALLELGFRSQQSLIRNGELAVMYSSNYP